MHGREAVRTDAHELMYHSKATQNNPVAHMNMTSLLRAVGKDSVVAHHAVMCQMHVSHDPVVVTNLGHARVSRRADIEGAKLTNGVAVTNDQLTGLARIFLVLRNRPQRIELKNAVVIADCGVAFDHTMRPDGSARADANIWADDGVRPHLNRAIELSLGVHNGGGVNEAHRLV